MSEIALGIVYQHNKNKVRQMVPKEIFEQDGKKFVRADSCTNLFQLKIPLADIHDGPASWGWSPVKSDSGSNGGGP